MAKELITLYFALLTLYGSLAEICQVVESDAYTYRVCQNTTANSWSKSRERCQNWDSQADLMTFPSEDEFNFILSHLEKVEDQTNVRHYAFIGLYQVKNTSANASPFFPQTGNYYWVTNPGQKITKDSGDFYYPFARFIEEFTSLEQVEQQKENLIISSAGDVLGGQTFNSPVLDGKFAPLLLICSRPGVSAATERVDGSTVDGGIPTWQFITIIAGAVVGLLVVIIVIAVVCRKCNEKRTHQFSKVPVQESSLTPTNSTYAPQNNKV